jgi:hypothetical protein
MSESGHFGLSALSMCRDPDILARRNFFASGHFAQTGDTYVLVGFRGSLDDAQDDSSDWAKSLPFGSAWEPSSPVGFATSERSAASLCSGDDSYSMSHIISSVYDV